MCSASGRNSPHCQGSPAKPDLQSPGKSCQAPSCCRQIPEQADFRVASTSCSRPVQSLPPGSQGAAMSLSEVLKHTPGTWPPSWLASSLQPQAACAFLFYRHSLDP